MEGTFVNPQTITPASVSHKPSAAIRVPELLAPAGDWECAKAAVENGADAIYFGLEKFNARLRAHNFTEGDLPPLMEFLHRRGCKGYVTFNTLVFENELEQAEEYLRAIIRAGVDAAIVQDVGICRLIRELSPDFPIHVSTQMTITSAAGVEFARELDCNLVVLARECSLKEIGQIIEQQKQSNGVAALPLEVFVHGALCVAYSGQCLTSEALGGRSANRGECAQACRMPYDFISDGKQVPLGDRRYLLSPQDLAGLEVLPELVQAGVASLKIEGRLKSPEYVASITRIYREALDKLSRNSSTRCDKTDRSQYEMEMAFSRGLYTGWFRGSNNQELVHARFGKKRGVYLGELLRVEGEQAVVRLGKAIKSGDGVVFDNGNPENSEQGGRVYQVEARSTSFPTEARLSFGRDALDWQQVKAGAKLWKTSDPELEREVRQTFAGDVPRFQRPVTMEVHGKSGERLTLIVRDEESHVVKVESTVPLIPAQKQPLTTERLTEQLGRLGGTPFKLADLKNLLQGEILLPVKELNRLRREAVEHLEKLRTAPRRWELNPARSRPVVEGTDVVIIPQPSGPPKLVVLARTMPQLEAAMSAGVRTLYCEFEDPKRYREAVSLARNWRGQRVEIFVAPPRVFKNGEEWILKLVRSCEADGYLARNYDHLRFFSTDRCVGDFSLNISNRLSADYFKNRFKLECVTASYDLNFSQLESLLQAAPASWFEVTVHQHMPMFHMEHCVFCAFLSTGTDYRNCGRPCDRHDVKLRDRVGAEHPVKADVGCRNTVFNALAQSGAEYVAPLAALGLRRFRIEFVNETPEQTKVIVAKYQQLLRGEINGGDVWRELKIANRLGVTRGQMAEHEPLR